MSMLPFQLVQVQTFNAGVGLTGVLPNGTDSLETKLRGRYRTWTACTDGGRFQQPEETSVHDSMSGRVQTIMWNLPGTTDIIFTWEDMNGLQIPFWPVAGGALPTRGFFDPQQMPLILPQGALIITATGPIGVGGGQIGVQWEVGMEQDMYKDIPGLGSMALVPLFS